MSPLPNIASDQRIAAMKLSRRVLDTPVRFEECRVQALL